MSGYRATGYIEKIEWEIVNGYKHHHAVSVRVAIPASEFTGLDITHPITITQEVAADE